jgi:hypothetical protein
VSELASPFRYATLNLRLPFIAPRRPVLPFCRVPPKPVSSSNISVCIVFTTSRCNIEETKVLSHATIVSSSPLTSELLFPSSPHRSQTSTFFCLPRCVSLDLSPLHCPHAQLRLIFLARLIAFKPLSPIYSVETPKHHIVFAASRPNFHFIFIASSQTSFPLYRAPTDVSSNFRIFFETSHPNFVSYPLRCAQTFFSSLMHRAHARTIVSSPSRHTPNYRSNFIALCTNFYSIQTYFFFIAPKLLSHRDRTSISTTSRRAQRFFPASSRHSFSTPRPN